MRGAPKTENIRLNLTVINSHCWQAEFEGNQLYVNKSDRLS